VARYLIVRKLCVALLLLSLSTSACLGRRGIKHPELPSQVNKLTLIGQFSIPALTRFPPVYGLPFGGISGLTSHNEGRDIYGISDAQHGGRIYRFAIADGNELSLTTVSGTALGMAPSDTRPDHEGIAILPDGSFAVSAEGSGDEPRLPPSINIYGRHGDFVKHLTVPAKFIPAERGEATHGVRSNAGFESLGLSPDGRRLYTAAEMTLRQDGDAPTMEAGGRTRLIEYHAHDDSFEPRREFAYDLEPAPKATPAPTLSLNGLVDVLVLDRNTLLTLERGYVENRNEPARSRSQIRIYRVSLVGATDISAIDSLKGRTDVVPVAKTLLLDLSETPGLSKELAPSLDNFEGLTIGPRLPDGRATLLLVSDDNFSPLQRTWFLRFAIE
jgi:3-phytase